MKLCDYIKDVNSYINLMELGWGNLQLLLRDNDFILVENKSEEGEGFHVLDDSIFESILHDVKNCKYSDYTENNIKDLSIEEKNKKILDYNHENKKYTDIKVKESDIKIYSMLGRVVKTILGINIVDWVATKKSNSGKTVYESTQDGHKLVQFNDYDCLKERNLDDYNNVLEIFNQCLLDINNIINETKEKDSKNQLTTKDFREIKNNIRTYIEKARSLLVRYLKINRLILMDFDDLDAFRRLLEIIAKYVNPYRVTVIKANSLLTDIVGYESIMPEPQYYKNSIGWDKISYNYVKNDIPNELQGILGCITLGKRKISSY